MIKLILLVLGSIIYHKACCQKYPGLVELTAVKKDCVLKLLFKNTAGKNVNIPNYYSMSDTIDGMYIFPNNIISIKKDTLILSSIHKDTLYGNTDSMSSRGVMIGHQASDALIVSTASFMELKRRKTQVLRLPADYCVIKLRFCKVFVDERELATCRVKIKE